MQISFRNGNSVAKNIFEDIKRSKDVGQRNLTATAVELFQRAADLGNCKALPKLAVIFDKGLNGIEKDCIKVYQLLLQAAENGETGALYWLAFILEDEDSSEFEDMCRSAGEDDSSISKQISDDMTRNDEIGKRPASVAAVRLLRRAVSSEHAAAMGRLGTSLKYGYGVQRDIITGIAWMEKAVYTDPSDIDLKATLAKALTSEEVGKYVIINRAIELLEEATQQYPSFCYGLHHLAVLYCLRGDNAKRDNFRAATLFSRASVLSSSLEDPRLPMTERIIRAGEHYPAEIDAFLRTSDAKPRTSLVLVLGGGARGKTSTANSLRGLPFIPTHITTEMAALNKFLVEPGTSWLDDSVTSEYEFNETSLRANSSRPQAMFRQSSDNGTDGKEAEGIETAAKESICERDLSNHSIFKMRHSKHADIIESVRGSMTMPEFPKGFRKSVAQVWDMTEQSKYEMTHALVIVRASVLVFVKDLSKVYEERMRKHEVEILCYWMQLAHFIVPDASKVRVIIVGTRKDACDHRAALQALKKAS